MSMHAHIQIEYTKISDGKDGLFKEGDHYQAESLVGFDPGDNKDRDMVHQMVDEYLDYLVEMKGRMIAKNLKESVEHLSNHLEISGFMGTH